VRRDVVDAGGKVSIRHHSRLMHIYVGRRHIGQKVILHVINDDVRVLTDKFKLLGEVTLDGRHAYQSMKRVD
jgi:hypothetical protein